MFTTQLEITDNPVYHTKETLMQKYVESVANTTAVIQVMTTRFQPCCGVQSTLMHGYYTHLEN